jgi:hypothetical protein
MPSSPNPFSNFIKVIKDILGMIWFAIYHFIKGKSPVQEYQKYCDQRTLAFRENLKKTEFGQEILNQFEKLNGKNDEKSKNTNTNTATTTEIAPATATSEKHIQPID